MAGNEFEERDTTCVLDILDKYLPERARLRQNLFKKATIDYDIGLQCLQDIIYLCCNTERVVYHPGLCPEDGRCPGCSISMSR